MLRMIELEKFKCFGKPARARLAPITLVFGQNSSGKSSLLQSLYLLKQTQESGTSRALCFDCPNGYADLGGIRNLMYNCDTDTQLSIRIDVNVSLPHYLSETNSQTTQWLNSLQAKSFGLKLQLAKVPNADDIVLCGFDLYVDDEPEPMASYSGEQVVGGSIEEDDEPCAITWFMLTNTSSLARYWIHDFEKRSEVADSWREATAEAPQEEKENHVFLKEVAERLAQTDTLQEFIEKAQKLCLNIGPQRLLIGTEQFLPGTPSDINKELRNEFSNISDDDIDYDDRLVQFSIDVDDKLNAPPLSDCNPFALTVACSVGIMNALARVVPLGPFRPNPDRYFSYSAKNPQDVGRNGEKMPEMLFRDRALLKKVNDWLDHELDLGYEIEMKEVQNTQFQLLLRDLRRQGANPVSIADVGYGISQLLPLVVQSLSGSGRTILVEQPETHIHPALQARLGTLLSSAAKERKHQFIIETHSEHLILRLLREIRRGRLSPCDVSVLYVDRGPDGSTIQEIRIDVNGDFLDEWPRGFFPERLREIIDTPPFDDDHSTE